jgi:GAF domain-containing protein
MFRLNFLPMQTPLTPVNEILRLDTLRALHILDTAPEERFDRLTRIAKRLFDVPIVLVSLVDTHRQWFKSCIGIDATETTRDISFCAHAIHGDDIFEIPDARNDARFADNPLVLHSPGIRFYAGCPLNGGNGAKLGTLCLIDTRPRMLDAEGRSLLRDLARMTETELSAVSAPSEF